MVRASGNFIDNAVDHLKPSLHSSVGPTVFRGAAEFRAEPRNFGFSPRHLSRGNTAEFVFVTRNAAEF